MSADTSVPRSGTTWWHWFTAGRVAAVGSLLGLAALCYVTGAAAMYFHLPSSDFLSLAFAGGQDITDPGPDAAVNGDLNRAGLTTHRPADAFEGYTLFTTTQAAEATLLDMKGNKIHRWQMPATPVWPVGGVAQDKPLHFERVHVYPTGDILALCCSGGDVPYGSGVVKLDKEAHFLWGYEANVHHDLDVGDDGRIYVLTQKVEMAAQPGGAPVPGRGILITEQVVVLSPEGKELTTIPLLEAFAKSPYAMLLPRTTGAEAGNVPPRPGGPPRVPGRGAPPGPTDGLHSNSVKVLSAALAPKFPLFKAGQLLLSLRTPNALAVVDPATGSVVWAAKGIWQSQHDADFLDNGHLLLFDNLGAGRAARVLEYDPNTQAIPWSCGGEGAMTFGATFRGTSQRLANGNTLIVDPSGCRILEVGVHKEAVWEWGLPPVPIDPNAGDASLNITGARRFTAAELPFLKGS